MIDIFVSYKRDDLKRALWLVQGFEEFGYSVWWDRKLTPGEEWQQRINAEVRSSTCVVVLWTENSIADDRMYSSDPVREEAEIGASRGTLIPLRLDDSISPPLQHSSLHAFDLFKWKGNTDSPAFHEFVRAAILPRVGSRDRPEASELRDWKAAKAINRSEAFEHFRAQYPTSRFAAVAESRLIEEEVRREGVIFFNEDDDQLERIYHQESLLTYPLPSSDRKVAYVAYKGLYGERASNIIVNRHNDDWIIPRNVKLLTEQAYIEWKRFSERQQRFIYHGNNARCSGVTIDHSSGQTYIKIQKVNYEHYIRTNLVIDYHDDARLSLREKLHNNGRLDKFEDSNLANTIGVNILIVNNQGDVPLQIRSAAVAVRPNQICSSASGTFEYGDVTGDGVRLSDCDLMREAVFELGAPIGSKLTNPAIVGLARELARGGQLEIFIVCNADFSQEELETSARDAEERDEWLGFDYLRLERRGEKYTKKQIEIAINNLELKHQSNLSAPLRAHLSLWFSWLIKNGLMI